MSDNESGNKSKGLIYKFKVGDLVRVKKQDLPHRMGAPLTIEDSQYNVALIVEKATSWLTPLRKGESIDVWDIGTRYWDDVNYAPFKIQTLSGDVFWASAYDLEMIDND